MPGGRRGERNKKCSRCGAKVREDELYLGKYCNECAKKRENSNLSDSNGNARFLTMQQTQWKGLSKSYVANNAYNGYEGSTAKKVDKK